MLPVFSGASYYGVVKACDYLCSQPTNDERMTQIGQIRERIFAYRNAAREFIGDKGWHFIVETLDNGWASVAFIIFITGGPTYPLTLEKVGIMASLFISVAAVVHHVRFDIALKYHSTARWIAPKCLS